MIAEYDMRASAGESARAKRYDGTVQESRMSSRDLDRSVQWRERVADLLRVAQRSIGTQALVPARRDGYAR